VVKSAVKSVVDFGITGCCECSTLYHIWDTPLFRGDFPFGMTPWNYSPESTPWNYSPELTPWNYSLELLPEINSLELLLEKLLLILAVDCLEVSNIVFLDDASELFAACRATEIFLVDITFKADDLAARGAFNLEDLLELVFQIL